MKKFLLSFLLSLFGWIWFFLFLVPTPSLASCDFSLEKLSVCYNSRTYLGIDPWGYACYNGNWRIRGAIFNTGDMSGSGVYEISGAPGLSGIWKSAQINNLKPLERLDTNFTTTRKLCGRVFYKSICGNDISNVDEIGFNASPLAKDISACFSFPTQ